MPLQSKGYIINIKMYNKAQLLQLFIVVSLFITIIYCPLVFWNNILTIFCKGLIIIKKGFVLIIYTDFASKIDIIGLFDIKGSRSLDWI